MQVSLMGPDLLEVATQDHSSFAPSWAAVACSLAFLIVLMVKATTLEATPSMCESM